MAEVKKASLTVLGGPLAGTRTLLPDDAEITVGSSEECALCLEQPTVSAVHARLVTEDGAITVFSAGSDRPLHVNDSPVTEAGLPLRNGDILWLGTPGEDDVVMLQCILPRRAAAAPEPEPPPEPAEVAEEPAPTEPTPEIETTALWTGAGAEETTSLSNQATVSFAAGDEDIEATVGDPTVAYAESSPPTAEPASGDEPLMLSFGEEASSREAPSAANDEAVIVDDEPAPPPAAFLPVDDDLVAEPAEFAAADDEPAPPPAEFASVDEDEVNAVVVDDGELDSDVAPTFIAAPSDFVAPEPEATVALDPGEDVVPLIEPDAFVTPEPEPPAPPPAPAASAPPAPPPPRAPAAKPASRPAAPSAPTAPAAPRPARPMPPPSASMARRRPAPRRDSPAASQVRASPAARGGGRSMVPILAVVGVLVVAAVGFAVWRFVLARPSSSAGTPVASATPFLPPGGVATPPPPINTPPPVAPDDTAVPTPEPLAATPEPTATPVAAAATPTPVAAPTPTPTPTPTPAARPTPTPTPPPAPPPAVDNTAAQTAQQVQNLLAQANASVGARQYDAAIGQLDEALRLDPGNAQARSARADAVARRDLAKRRFVAGRTRVQTEKADAGGLAGFDTGGADLRKAPDFQGRIEFEMSPPAGIQPGDGWSLNVYVINEGKKPIRVEGVTVTTKVNGSGAGDAVAPRASQIAPQQRALVAATSGSWADGTTAWATDVAVTANKGDSLQATLNWR